MKSYEEIRNLYFLLAFQERLIREELVAVFQEIQFKGDRNAGMQGKGYILEAQCKEEQSRDKEFKNRFYRNTEENKFMVKNENIIPELYESEPSLPGENKIAYGDSSMELSTISESKYNNYNEAQKKKLELLLYKRLALIHARRSNLANRKKRSDSSAMTRKDMEMEEFIYYAMKHNNLALEEDKICFGFTPDEKGAIRLDASLPGYTRLSVHFGNLSNFYSILKNVNNKCEKRNREAPFKSYTDREGRVRIDKSIFKDYQYSLPTFGVINTGLINRDDFNAMRYEKIFKQKIKDKDGKVDIYGIEEIINILYTDFNDREIFYLAEKAGAGKGILEELNKRLQERKKIRDLAKKNNRSLQEEYILSSDDKKISDVLTHILMANDDTIIELINSTIIKSGKFDIDNCAAVLKKAKKIGVEQDFLQAIEEEIELNGLYDSKSDLDRIYQTIIKPKDEYNKLKDIAIRTSLEDRVEAQKVEDRFVNKSNNRG